ncbi:MAG: IclR family transcriptional regulator [Janthinobacterium lividum]|uniref:IclR family transcriptional regulator n=1 Tax=Pseudomonas TaxID=286 RepID=UPI001CFC0CE3|nr:MULTISPECIES: IclR family transcriptional regulator [Pseudomonas]
MSSDDAERSGIQVISRAASILRSLEDEPKGLSLGEIAKRIELPRSTVQRLVDALALEQLLEVRGAGGVRLGPALMRLAARSHLDITHRARAFLEALSHQTGETAVLTHANGLEMLILHSVVSHQELRVAPGSGTFLTVYASSAGKVVLASMSDDAVIEMLTGKMKQMTPMTRTLEQLLVELAAVRREGFAYDAGEHRTGVGSVSTSLPIDQGHYAVSVVGPTARIAEAHDSIKMALKECRQGILQVVF